MFPRLVRRSGRKKDSTCPAHLGDTIAASRAIRSAFFPLTFKPCSRHSTRNCFTVRFLLQEHQRMRTHWRRGVQTDLVPSPQHPVELVDSTRDGTSYGRPLHDS